MEKIGKDTCKSVEVHSNDAVNLNFFIPEQALGFRIIQDGTSIFQTEDKTESTKLITELVPGQSYRFRCQILMDVSTDYHNVGDELKVTMPIGAPPTFSGLTNASLSTSSSVLLEWNRTEDSILSYYKIFKYVGIATDKSDFSTSDYITVTDLVSVSNIVNNLGDELTYSFRVSACNVSNVCDDNNSIRTITTPDTGAPLSSGATDIAVVDSNVNLEVPWVDQNGAVAKRGVYRVSTASASACPVTFGAYTKINDVIVLEPRNTPTTITDASPLGEGFKYCYVVRDEDPSGNTETNFNVQSIVINDITKPDFTSLVSLSRKSGDEENTIEATWEAMVREIDDPLLGAHEYQVYISTASLSGGLEPDPCATGSLYETILAAGFSQGSTVTSTINGLSPRDWHRVCVKAVDSALNPSTQSPNAVISTGDMTAPSFTGIQSLEFNISESRMDFTFIVPPDLDVREYKLTTVRTRQGVENAPVLISIPIGDLGVLTPGSLKEGSFTLSQASLLEDDEVNVRLDACDNASPVYSSADNCSTTLENRDSVVPDTTPPLLFSGVTLANMGSTHRSISVEWNLPVDKSDYAGFTVYFVEGGMLTELNSTACSCTNGDCATFPKFSCEVDSVVGGGFLIPSKSYEIYVEAYDSGGYTTRSYIDYTGPSRVTAYSQATDLTAPTFSPGIALDSVGGVEVSFAQAVDDQDPSLEMEYEIYKKQTDTFICLDTPYESAGGCDGLSPIVDQAANLFASGAGGRLVYTDPDVIQGQTYYYQICALDNANNRTCSSTDAPGLEVADLTPPVAENFTTTKLVSSTTWDIGFDISDLGAEINELTVKIYRSDTDYPVAAGPPLYQVAAGTVTVNPLTGHTQFTDTGLADLNYYYTAKVQDPSGNFVEFQFRDMYPTPVITSVTFDGGEQAHDSVVFPPQPQFQDFLISGQNFRPGSVVKMYNDGVYINDCDAVGPTINPEGTEIRCQGGGGDPSKWTFTAIDFEVVTSDEQTALVADAINLTSHCENFTSKTTLEGAGTPEDPYDICFPEHLTVIGGGTAYTGHFRLMRDMDVAIDAPGFTFEGIPNSTPSQFTIHGNNYTIKNLNIESALSKVGFLQSCTGDALTDNSLISFLKFENLNVIDTDVVQAGTGGLVGQISCSMQTGIEHIKDVTLTNTTITAGNNQVGGVVGNVRSFAEDLILSNINIDGMNLIHSRTSGPSSYWSGVVGQRSVSNNTTQISNSTVKDLEILAGESNTQLNFVGGLMGSVNISSGIIIDNNNLINFKIRRENLLENSFYYVGGLVGRVNKGSEAVLGTLVIQDNEIEFLATGISNGEKYASLGGLVGYKEKNFSVTAERNKVNFLNTGSDLRDLLVGGLFGTFYTGASDIIRENSVEVDISEASSDVGGFIGKVYASDELTSSFLSLEDNFIFGSVTASTGAAGMIGSLEITTGISNVTVEIQRNYVNASVISGAGVDPIIEEFIDAGSGNSINLSRNYYESSVNSTSVYDAAGEVEAKTFVELQSPATFIDWDFTTIWNDRSGLGQAPNLKWEL
ncbi:MAG: hypothetical protein ACRBBP_06105 [Bdellovibrionales bacterium]